MCCAVNYELLFRLCYFYVICVFCRLVVLRLSAPVQVTDWKVSSPEKTYNMLMGTLNPTHSLTEWLYPQLQQSLDCGLEVLTITVTFTRRCEIHNQNEKKRSGRRKHCARAGCSKVRTPPAGLPARCKHINTQTGLITIHCAAS